MEASTYTSAELLRTAKWTCKGMGRYLRWELRILPHSTYAVLLVHYRERGTGEIKIMSCAI